MGQWSIMSLEPSLTPLIVAKIQYLMPEEKLIKFSRLANHAVILLLSRGAKGQPVSIWARLQRCEMTVKRSFCLK